jgi:predicted nucleotidyltransferase component of viral defense system
MISKNELLEIAKLMGMNPWQQEKHYVQYLALNGIAEEPLVFKGGTYLWFAHGLGRFSEDLDFTASEPLPSNIAEKVSTNLGLFGVENQIKHITNNETTLSFRISAKGPLSTAKIDECIVYIEISKREQILKKVLPVKLDYPAYSSPIKTISGMALEEVGAEKVRAIFTRQKARDIFDLHYLISKKRIKFDENLVNSKLQYYKMKFSASLFLKAIADKQDYYVRELKGLVFGELPQFREIKKSLSDWISR